jgi:hypothetical protein
MMSDDEDYDNDLDDRLIIDDSAAGNGLELATRKGNIQNRTYICRHCGFATTSATEHLTHVRSQHGDQSPIFKCDLCNYATKYKQKLARHRRLHFSGQLPHVGGSPSDIAPVLTMQTSSSPSPSLPVLTTASTSSLSRSAAAAALITLTPGMKRSAADTFSPEPPTLLPHEVIMDENDEDDGDDEVEDTVSLRSLTPLEVEAEAGSSLPPAKKKRKDVSPDKYFEVSVSVLSAVSVTWSFVSVAHQFLSGDH